MTAHRQLVREYRDAWIHFRTHKTPGKAMKEKIEEAEDALDVFNLDIARQRAEVEIDRRHDLARVEHQQQSGWVGWVKNWWYGGSP
uniref:Transposase n=1 Tax=Globodera pallida TaxID=36090 RepID=A0A183CBP4_GLOPA